MPTVKRVGRWMIGGTAACLVLAGCTQQDTDTLARMSRKFIDRSQRAADSIRVQVEGDLRHIPHGEAMSKEPGLKEKVEARLRFDAPLADAKIEVSVTGAEVELRGTVKSDAQRRRASDLVETTAGVQVVNDALKVEE
jgi:hypothetical protein